MMVQTNKVATQKFVEMFGTGDLTEVSQLISASYVDHQGLGGNPMCGTEGFSQVVTATCNALPNLQIVIEDLIAHSASWKQRVAFILTAAACGETPLC